MEYYQTLLVSNYILTTCLDFFSFSKRSEIFTCPRPRSSYEGGKTQSVKKAIAKNEVVIMGGDRPMRYGVHACF